MPPQTPNNLPQNSSSSGPTPVPVFTATPSSGIKTMPTSPEEAQRATAPSAPVSIPTPPQQNPSFIPPGVVVPPAPTVEPIIPRATPIPTPPPQPTPQLIPKPVVSLRPPSYREPILESDKVLFPPVAAPVEEKKPEPTQEKNPAIRTLQGDIAETVQGRGLSIADIALAEQKKNADSDTPRPKPHQPTNWWVVGTIIFVLLTLAIVMGIVYLAPDTEVPIVEEPLSQTQFPADAKTALDVTGMTFDGFTREIKTRLLGDLNLGTIETVSLLAETNIEAGATAILTTNQFFSLIKSRAPARLVRSLEDSFVFGIATVDRPTGFAMFSTNVFETAFAGMLEWEPYIVEDLPFIAKEIFVLPPAPVFSTPIATTTATTSTNVASSTATTSTPVTPVIPQEKPKAVFKDIVIQNEDARAAMLPDGTILLVYSFPDKNTLIITQTKEALTLILQRLSTARFTR